MSKRLFSDSGDTLVSTRHSWYLHKKMPKAEYHVWKDAGHAIHMQYPEQLNQAIRDFTT